MLWLKAIISVEIVYYSIKSLNSTSKMEKDVNDITPKHEQNEKNQRIRKYWGGVTLPPYHSSLSIILDPGHCCFENTFLWRHIQRIVR